MCVYMYLFEELQLNSILEELSHGTGSMTHKGLLIKCYWLALKMQEYTYTVSVLYNTVIKNTFNFYSVPISTYLWPC